MRKNFVPILTAFVFAIALKGQDPESAELRGELHQDRTVMFERFIVSVYDILGHLELGRAAVSADGSFTLYKIPLGHHSLRITTEQGETIEEIFVDVTQHSQHIEVQLPRQIDARPASGPVSVRQLSHPPARKAYNAFVDAQRFSEAHQYEKAAGELEKAIRISPEYAEAHSNLAVQYIRMRRIDDALAEIDRAASIAGPNSRDLSNRAFALEMAGRHAEAVECSRAAVRLDPSNAQAQYLLGNLLATDPRTIGESVAHLERAADAMPVAREALQKVRALLR